MKATDIKTSGVLEAYALGLVSDQEKREVEQLIASHPDLDVHLAQLETSLVHQFRGGLVPPPPALRSLVEQRIDPSTPARYNEPYQAPHESNTNRNAGSGYVDVQVSNTHIQVHKYWRTAFIAVFILSKIFLAVGLYYYFKAQSQEQEIERLNQQVQQTAPVRTN